MLGADRSVVLQQLVGSDWVIQAGFAHVDVAVGRKGGQQGQQRPRVHVVVIVNMAQPSRRSGNTHTHTRSLLSSLYYITLHYNHLADGLIQNDEQKVHNKVEVH